MSLKVKCFPYGKYGENTYVLTDEDSGYIAIVDPGYYGSEVEPYISDPTNLKFILLTHGHDDHFNAVKEYKNLYEGAIFAAPSKEIGLMEENGCPKPDFLLIDGDIITLGSTDFRVIETPGHTSGGVCFASDNEIFTGDTLFKLSVGRTDLPTGDWDTLMNSITDKLYTLNEELIVYPGHGEATTIGYEKRSNPFV